MSLLLANKQSPQQAVDNVEVWMEKIKEERKKMKRADSWVFKSSMASLFRLGQLLRGSAGTYIIQKQLHESIWLATSHSEQTVVIKSVQHFRLDNERAVLKRFRARTSSPRPLIDEIHDPPDTPALVLRHLDDDLMSASASQRLTKSEIKHVAKRVLEALKLLHEEHYVHTDFKLDNVFVNYGKGEHRFTDVQLGDCGNTVPDNSPWARDCDMMVDA